MQGLGQNAKRASRSLSHLGVYRQCGCKKSRKRNIYLNTLAEELPMKLFCKAKLARTNKAKLYFMFSFLQDSTRKMSTSPYPCLPALSRITPQFYFSIKYCNLCVQYTNKIPKWSVSIASGAVPYSLFKQVQRDISRLEICLIYNQKDLQMQISFAVGLAVSSSFGGTSTCMLTMSGIFVSEE